MLISGYIYIYIFLHARRNVLRLSFGFRSETYNQREFVCGQLTIILELLGIFSILISIGSRQWVFQIAFSLPAAKPRPNVKLWE